MIEATQSTRLDEGKYVAMVFCWLLGNGALFCWNSMLTVGDYYANQFPHYHSARILTICYQPFSLLMLTVFACNEAKINTRLRVLAGYTLFFLSALAVLVLNVATSARGVGPFIGLCITSLLFGVSDGHVQGGMIGDLSFMPSELVQSYLAGVAASGVFTSALRMITKAVFEKSNHGLRKGASVLTFSYESYN